VGRRETRRRRLHPFLDEPGPIAIAHRGGIEDAPANTVEAFAAAVALGYRYLETDAQVTRDGVVVAFHDLRLDAATDRTGAIGDLPYAAVAEADAGFGFTPDRGRSFPFRGCGARIPRLEEVLTWPGVRVNVDPKTSACVEPLVALVDRLDAWDRVGFGSFSDRRLRRIRELSGGRACTSMGPRAVFVARTAVAATGRLPRRGADCLQVPLRVGPIAIVSAPFVRAAHRAGLPVHVWTVNDEQVMHEVLDLGVDGVMTDRPRLLRDVLRDRGSPLAPPLGVGRA
jgi:glycerophosphoryl diester phosphodiesterase